MAVGVRISIFLTSSYWWSRIMAISPSHLLQLGSQWHLRPTVRYVPMPREGALQSELQFRKPCPSEGFAGSCLPACTAGTAYHLGRCLCCGIEAPNSTQGMKQSTLG